MTDAEGVLKQGYETTGSKVLLQNYCATVLNEVVKAVNENRAGISEISRCVDVLEADPDNADAPEILQTCIGRFWNGTAGKQIMLEGVGDFAAYEEAADRLLLLAEQDGAYKAAAESLVVPAGGQAYLSLSNKEGYQALLTLSLIHI